MGDGVKRILVCSLCGQDISRAVKLGWKGEIADVNKEENYEVEFHQYGDYSLVPEGFALMTFKPMFEGKPGLTKTPDLDFSPQIWMSQIDILDRVDLEKSVRSRCKCGAPVGFSNGEFGSHDMGYYLTYFIPAPNKTKWRDAP